MKSFLRIVTLLVALGSASLVHAEDIRAVQGRMQSRLPAIDQMKQSGVVGENNTGLLEGRGSLSADQSSTVSQENSDRTLVYAELGKKNNTSAEQVGKLRAKQIAERSAAGIWLQDETGRWYKK